MIQRRRKQQFLLTSLDKCKKAFAHLQILLCIKYISSQTFDIEYFLLLFTFWFILGNDRTFIGFGTTATIGRRWKTFMTINV